MDLKFFIGLMFFLLLGGCEKQTENHDYLLQHPQTLRDEYKTCEYNRVNDLHCYMIKRAVADFVKLLNEHNQNPEAFGQKIMLVQAALAEPAGSSEIYEKNKQELNILYAILSLKIKE